MKISPLHTLAALVAACSCAQGAVTWANLTNPQTGSNTSTGSIGVVGGQGAQTAQAVGFFNASFGNGVTGNVIISVNSSNGVESDGSNRAPDSAVIDVENLGMSGTTQTGLSYATDLTSTRITPNDAAFEDEITYTVQFTGINNSSNATIYLFVGQQSVADGTAGASVGQVRLSDNVPSQIGSDFALPGGNSPTTLGTLSGGSTPYVVGAGGNGEAQGIIVSLAPGSTQATLRFDTNEQDSWNFAIGTEPMIVPEPSSLLLLGLGSLGLLARRRS